MDFLFFFNSVESWLDSYGTEKYFKSEWAWFFTFCHYIIIPI